MTTIPQSSDEEAKYKTIFELLSTNTEEYDNFVSFIEDDILPQLPSRQAFLDIGAGRGNLTKSIAKHFSNASFVEPNSQFFNDVMAWSQSAYPQIIGYNLLWQNVELQTEFELAVISHVLYYISPDDYHAFIHKAYHSLSSQGCLIISLYGTESDTWKLSQLLDKPEILSKLPYAEKLYKQIEGWGLDAKYYPFESRIVTQTYEQMCLMIDFLLLDRVSFDDTKSAVRDSYIQQHLVREKDYSIRSSGGIIVIRKP